MLAGKTDIEYRHALALVFARFAARGRALRLNQTTGNDNLGRETLPAAAGPLMNEEDHDPILPQSIEFESDDLLDPARQLDLEPPLGGPAIIADPGGETQSSGSGVGIGDADYVAS